jgi:hypothetical protein
MLNIGYDRELSTEFEPRYFVYDSDSSNAIVYSGTYIQCLVIINAVALNPDITIEEIRSKSNGFI